MTDDHVSVVSMLSSRSVSIDRVISLRYTGNVSYVHVYSTTLRRSSNTFTNYWHKHTWGTTSTTVGIHWLIICDSIYCSIISIPGICKKWHCSLSQCIRFWLHLHHAEPNEHILHFLLVQGHCDRSEVSSKGKSKRSESLQEGATKLKKVTAAS